VRQQGERLRGQVRGQVRVQVRVQGSGQALVHQAPALAQVQVRELGLGLPLPLDPLAPRLPCWRWSVPAAMVTVSESGVLLPGAYPHWLPQRVRVPHEARCDFVSV
jgi:hypothetical protein